MNIISKRQSFLISTTLILLFNLSSLSAQAPFITTWKTNNLGISNSSSVTILVDPSYTYNYDIDWNNDGVYDDFNVIGDITHDYIITYNIQTIAIRGVFPKMYFNNSAGDHKKLMTIEQWGDIAWEDMSNAFESASNMTYNAVDMPDLSNVSDMSYMFYGENSFDGDLSNWNTSNITNMSHMFSFTSLFNGNISTWNTTNVTNMAGMFYGANSFNGDLNNWNTVNVTDMTSIFRAAASFNGNISSWNMVNITDMSNMFRDAVAFNSDINNWNTVNVTDMSNMFYNADAFNGNLNSWNTLNVVDMSSMFLGADSFNGDLNNWNTANVTDMYAMFNGAVAFNQDLNNWNTANVTDMSSMFGGANSFNGNISNWNTANVTDMSNMFVNVSNFNSNINSWNTSNVTSMGSMFSGASSFNQDLDNWDVGSVNDMAGMFFDASSFNGNIGNWNVAYVTYMEYMFYNASLFDQNLSNWNLQFVSFMDYMLDNCGMSMTNYDNTLIGWISQNPQSYINLGAAGLNYCSGEAARNTLINTYNWTITGDALDCPSNCFPPNNATVEVITPTTALFSWDAMPEATYYQVKYRLRGTEAWSTSGTANTQRNIPNLIDKKYYQFKVRSQCGAEWSDFTAVQLFYTSTCDVPTGVASIYLDNTRMRVRWDNNPAEIKGKIRYRAVGITGWITQNSADGNNFLYLNNLPADALIQYKVRSNCDGNDWSAYSPLYTHDLSVGARLGQEEITLASTKIYPNPTRDILNLEFESLDAEEINIIISDNLGKNIHTINKTYDEGIQIESIDMSQFTNGYYFITIQSGEKMETQKFMKID